MKSLINRKLLYILAIISIAISGCDSGGGGGSTTTFSIGGTISGLKANTSVVLKDNGGNPLTITQNGNFQFSQQIPDNGNYVVTVATQPTSETCTVTNGDGANIVANVTNINITCSNKTFTIGGTVSGLNPGSQVVLNNNNDNPITITQDGKFTFTTPIAFNSSYSVVVVKNPSGEICTAQNSIGYGVTSNIANIVVNCSNASFSIGGTVTGLLPGQQVTLKNNGTNALLLKSSGSFTFSTPIAAAGNYLVSVATEPANQTCTATNNQGSNVMANVSTVTVICHKDHYTVSGTVNGLLSGAQITLLNNGVDPVILLNNGVTNYNQFSFSPIAYGSGYNVTIGTQPDGESCTVTNSNGTNIKANVSNITVNCTQNYFSLYSFQGGRSDGATTKAGLIQASDGYLYGTTEHGGAEKEAYNNGNGGIYKIDPSTGIETLVYSFKGVDNNDGANPSGPLIEGTDGYLYGTTYNGGSNSTDMGSGTIFRFDTNNDTESPIYLFAGTNDGANPKAGLIQATDGYLYGTASNNGISSFTGTIFKVKTSGQNFSVLHSFLGINDGYHPTSGLIYGSDGNLYGTTQNGGSTNPLGSMGSGTIFKISESGTNYKILYSFQGNTNGAYPQSQLLEYSPGVFYGTVPYSSSNQYSGGSGNGLIYQYSQSSGYEVFYNFKNGGDGNYPSGGLIKGKDNNLYGVTRGGGTAGIGTIYMINPITMEENILYSFLGNYWGISDGADPNGTLLQLSDGSLYGVTIYGGIWDYGTVFKYM